MFVKVFLGTIDLVGLVVVGSIDRVRSKYGRVQLLVYETIWFEDVLGSNGICILGVNYVHLILFVRICSVYEYFVGIDIGIPCFCVLSHFEDTDFDWLDFVIHLELEFVIGLSVVSCVIRCDF